MKQTVAEVYDALAPAERLLCAEYHRASIAALCAGVEPPTLGAWAARRAADDQVTARAELRACIAAGVRPGERETA